MILGADHSRWDWMTGDGKYSPINYAASEARFVFLKACDGWNDTPYYAEEIDSARRAGKLAAPYVWLHARALQDPRRQAEFWFSRLGSEPLLVVDFEAYQSYTPDYDDLYNAIEKMRSLGFGGRIMIYTGHWYWLTHGSTASYWKQFPLWLARYTSEPPAPPPPWGAWTFWQFSASGDPTLYGITNGKKAVDENLFSGTDEELAALFKMSETTGETMAQYEVVSNNYKMSLRADHNTAAAKLAEIEIGVKMAADEIWTAPADLYINNVRVNAKDDKWAHVSVGGKVGWVAIVHLGKVYCTYTEIAPPPPPPPSEDVTVEVVVNGTVVYKYP